jgi:MFS family permease
MAVRTGAFAPLGNPTFRSLWIASLGSNLGTLVQGVGAAWLMTTLANSPLLVSLVQSATSLPAFLLALPAGALADVMDRRMIVLASNIWMSVVTALLAALTIFGGMSPGLLLGFTFVLGLGSALGTPAWQAILPEIVPREQLPSAVALNSAGFNLARSIGPAIGGLAVAWLGTGSTFALNALSYLGVIYVVARWRRQALTADLPAERMGGAMRVGLSYVRHAPDLRAVLARTALFIVFASAIWGLLPAVARYELAMGPTGYGVLLGCLGLGAVLGALVLPRLRDALGNDRLVVAGTLVYAGSTAVVALVPSMWAVAPALFVTGLAWLACMSSFNTQVQTGTPLWVRGRALAIYLLVVFGGMALGSAVWGAVAEHLRLSLALLAAATGLLAGLVAAARFPLQEHVLDLDPSFHWADPELYAEPRPDDGPVFVVVEYRIDPAEAPAFRAAMQELRRLRLRDGSRRWSLLHDVAVPERYLETFTTRTWAEHMRQHARITAADRAVEERARAFHRGDGPPVVSHLLGV